MTDRGQTKAEEKEEEEKKKAASPLSLICPVPAASPRILLAHGGGGTLMHDLIKKVLRPALYRDEDGGSHDSAVLDLAAVTASGRWAMTTDSYVVHPIVFPGGDIGRLSVFGTVNDLAMAGAWPRFLSVSLILEEGLKMEMLQTIVASIRQAAEETGIAIVTGDTKVIERRGEAEPGLFVTTTGWGEVQGEGVIHPKEIREGDRVVVSGDIGRHGIAVMLTREGLDFQTSIESDLAPLHREVRALLEAGLHPRCLRDLTRGGLGSALQEIADTGGLTIQIREEAIPIHPEVRAACEVLGLDAIFVANEGRFAAIVPPEEADRAVAVLRTFAGSREAAIVGEVQAKAHHPLLWKGRYGGLRPLILPSGEQLPRIC